MGQIFSYTVGILVAGLIVFGLRFGMQMASPAYARQAEAKSAAEQTLDELEERIRIGSLREKRAAVTAVGSGDDNLERRIILLAIATTSNDRSVQSLCALSVQRYGDRVKPTVRKMLDSDDPEMVRAACGIIRPMGTNGDEYAEDILKLLREGDEFDRHAALYALQDMSPEVLVPGVELVIKELDDENFNTQCQACFVLRRMGRGAEPAVERLVKLLQEGNVSTRSRAVQALAAIGPVDGYDIPGLVAERLGAHSHEEKVRTLDAIGDLGPDASEHLDKIEKLMQSPRLNCVAEAALAYYRVSGDAEGPLKMIMDLVGKRNTRMSALQCLGGMGEAASDSVPTIMEYLNDDDMGIVETAVLALKNIGPTAEAALPRLKKMLDHEDFLISVAAQEAIDAIKAK